MAKSGKSQTVDDVAEGINQFLRERVKLMMAEVGEESQARLRQAVSIPYPPSGPADTGPPALREGKIQEGIEHQQTEPTAGVIRETISSVRFGGNDGVPWFLEGGTKFAAKRPYMTTELNYLSENIVTIAAEKMRILTGVS